MRASLLRRTSCLLALAVSQGLWGGQGTTVNSTEDLPDVDVTDGVCRTVQNTCTLRAAIMQANASTFGDSITLPAGTYHLTIAPAGSDDDSSGDLNITSPGEVVIFGAEDGLTTIDAGGIDRIFDVASGGSLTLADVQLLNGLTSGSGGCIESLGYLNIGFSEVAGCIAQFDGGAIHTAGSAHLEHTRIHDARAIGGGGIENDGALTMINSTVERTVATVGGGLYAADGSNTVISYSSIISNTSYTQGGGIYGDAPLTATNSTIAGNNAHTDGGGVFFRTSTNVPANFFSATIAFNTADGDGDGTGSGGGIAVGGPNSDGNGSVNIYNTIIAGNNISGQRDSDDCDGRLLTHGTNRLGSTPYCDDKGCLPTGVEACVENIVSGQDDLLNSIDLLGNIVSNGGPTPTIALLAGSNAIDAGPAGGCRDATGNALVLDQRGFDRNVGAACDVGAFEFGSADPNDAIFANGFD